jgi:acetyl esterase/lipase
MALTLAMRWRRRFFPPERCPQGVRSSTCAVTRDDPKWLPNIKLQLLIYPPVQFVNFSLPSYLLFNNSVLSTRFMMTKSLVLWLYGEQLAQNTTLLNALYANSYTTARTREHLSRLYFDKAIDTIWGDNEMELVRSARRVLPASELDAIGDQQLESRFLPTLMSEEISPLFASDFSYMAPVYLVTAGLDSFRDELFLFVRRLQRSKQVAFVENMHYPDKYHGFLWMDPWTILDHFADFLRAHPNAL